MSEPITAQSQTRTARMNTKVMVSMAMLTAIAYIVMLMSKLMPSVYGFLDVDFKDVVICISGFTFGPMSAAIISIVVALIEMITISSTGPWGFLMNVLSSCAFACTAACVYKHDRSMKGAVKGLVLGVVLMVAVMMLWNYIVTPIYMGYPREAVAAMLLPYFLPFNLLKGGLNAAITMFLYKPIVQTLRRANLVPDGEQQGSALHSGILLVAMLIVVSCILLILIFQGII